MGFVYKILAYDNDSKILLGCEDGWLRSFSMDNYEMELEAKIHDKAIDDFVIIKHENIFNNKQVLITCSWKMIKILDFNTDRPRRPIIEK